MHPRYDYTRFMNSQTVHDTFDSPIRTRYPTEEFSPPFDNINHRTKIDQEISTDNSINRIKQEIEKSRRLIQEFQMRNRTTAIEPPLE